MKNTLSTLLIGTLILASVTACGTESGNAQPRTPKSITQKPAAAAVSMNPATQVPTAMPTAEDKPSAAESASNAEPLMSEPIVDRQIIDRTNADVIALMDSYKSILKNEATYVSTYSGENEYLNQTFISSGNDPSSVEEITHKAEEFAIIDLDGNGLPEVVLNMSINGHEDIILKILSSHENQVYGYTESSRSFSDLKIDGTFGWSAGAPYQSYGTMRFEQAATKNQALHVAYTYCDANDDIYVVNHQPVATWEEFLLAQDYEGLKPDVTWHECSDENIEKYFSL